MLVATPVCSSGQIENVSSGGGAATGGGAARVSVTVTGGGTVTVTDGGIADGAGEAAGGTVTL